MLVKMETGASGDSKIPFKVTVYSNRATINSQNFYLWNDNGTIKMHFEVDFTSATSLSANGAVLQGMIPFNPMAFDTLITPDSGYTSVKWAIRASSSSPLTLNLTPNASVTSGKNMVFNQDIVCNFGNS